MRVQLASILLLTIAVPVQSQVSSPVIRRDREAFVNRAPNMIARIPALTQATPSSAQQGQKVVSVSLTGYLTNFRPDTTVASFGPGVTFAAPLTVTSPTSATAILNIDPSTPSGGRTVILTTRQEVVTLVNGFTVTPQPDFFGKVCSLPTALAQLSRGMSSSVGGRLHAASVEDWFQVTFGRART